MTTTKKHPHKHKRHHNLLRSSGTETDSRLTMVASDADGTHTTCTITSCSSDDSDTMNARLTPQHKTLSSVRVSPTPSSTLNPEARAPSSQSPLALQRAHQHLRRRPSDLSTNAISKLNTPPRFKLKRLAHVVIAVCGTLWLAFLCVLLLHLHYGMDATVLHQHHFLSGNTNTDQHGGFRGIPLPPPRVTIPLPLPPHKVSALLINHSRPRMIQESSLMRTLLHHPSIDEVMLLHSNPKTAFELIHPKVINIDATRHNDEMGLSLRFYFCQLAKNDWVLHVDDDMEFTNAALSELLIEFGKNSKRIVGRFGRDLVTHNSFHGYSTHNTHRQTEVVLTKLMVMERNICGAFFEYSSLIFDDVILESGEGPLWNGEDIFMSLVANHVYQQDGNKNNYAMDWLDVWQAPDSLKDYDHGRLDISGGLEGIRLWDVDWWQSLLRRNRHYSYRGKLWHTAKERLQALVKSSLPP